MVRWSFYTPISKGRVHSTVSGLRMGLDGTEECPVAEEVSSQRRDPMTLSVGGPIRSLYTRLEGLRSLNVDIFTNSQCSIFNIPKQKEV